jgi:hypothetical protein
VNVINFKLIKIRKIATESERSTITSKCKNIKCSYFFPVPLYTYCNIFLTLLQFVLRCFYGTTAIYSEMTACDVAIAGIFVWLLKLRAVSCLQHTYLTQFKQSEINRRLFWWDESVATYGHKSKMISRDLFVKIVWSQHQIIEKYNVYGTSYSLFPFLTCCSN